VAIPSAAQEASSALSLAVAPVQIAAGLRGGPAAIALGHPASPEAQQLFPLRRAEISRRPAALMPLYGSLVALQGLDIHSTRSALESDGAREGNPAMRPLVRNNALFIGVKAGATAGVIWASEKMWRKKRKAAVVFASLVNVAMAAVVANNYRVSRGGTNAAAR
jgi:hypothetical protein